MVNVSLANREFLTSVAIFIYSVLISVSALIISIYAVGISLAGGLSLFLIYIGISLLILIAIIWVAVTIFYRKITKGFIPSLNKQYQNIHKTIHPELFKEGAGYYY